MVIPCLERYRKVRAASEALCAPLQPEDYGLQGMPGASPPKWHLAHTTWFFETFILRPFVRDYEPFHPGFEILFNSYYNGIGEQYPRPQRGLLSRPSIGEIYAYRTAIDRAMLDLLDSLSESSSPALDATAAGEVATRTELGLHHEQQHQELLLTDLKYSFALNPLHPVYRDRPRASRTPSGTAGGVEPAWLELPAGPADIGAREIEFSFDNERPRHRVWVAAAALAARPVTNAEYLRFIDDGGYERPELWLADGWQTVQDQGWGAPLYWQRASRRDARWAYTLHGLEPLEADAPVCHVSYYEADAYARWAGFRLPSEAEWELVANRYWQSETDRGQFVESDLLQPSAPAGTGLFGSVWEWTTSTYGAYPGFRAAPGAVGEYNGKFMCNQLVLRGGSCATPAEHIRPTYRNFFYPADRWQFSGIRLACEADRL